MKKVIIAVLTVVALSLAIATPVLADEGGVPNANADWGQAISSVAKGGGMGGHVSAQPTPRAWGPGGVRVNH